MRKDRIARAKDREAVVDRGDKAVEKEVTRDFLGGVEIFAVFENAAAVITADLVGAADRAVKKGCACPLGAGVGRGARAAALEGVVTVIIEAHRADFAVLE